MSNTLMAIRFAAEEVRTIAGGSIAIAPYMPIGSALEHPCRQFFLQNLTDQTLMFSFDGLTDHFPLPANGFFLDDVTSNASLSCGYFLAKGQTLYVRALSGAAITGDVYFSVFYADDGQ